MIAASDPNATGNSLRADLINGGAASSDPYVKKYVMAKQSLKKSMGDVPAEIEITMPADGANVDGFTNNEFRVQATDWEDDTFFFYWSSDKDGFLGIGPVNYFPNLSIGQHVITALTQDSGDHWKVEFDVRSG